MENGVKYYSSRHKSVRVKEWKSVGLDDCRIRRVYDWKSVRLEECKIGRV